MSKKSFTGGIDSLIGGIKPEDKALTNTGALQPPKIKKDKPNIRATFVISKDKLELLKSLAHWERTTQKELLDEAIDLLVEKRGEDNIKQAITDFNKTN